ncbi:MAG: hypothetical protein Q7Q71_04595 [Verrucomicrobiota bacterium JB023]|nr:hypothetical protein [Verrucomicrobiota bacterium JB023]
MNVFILNTGRCGSTTFAKACSHIENFTAKHESRTHLLGESRLNYPPNHIEADNRLSWLLGRLDETYGDSAFYVHLTREREQVAESFVKRYDSGIIEAYRGKGIMLNLPDNSNPLDVARDYCETVDSNIRLFLRDKSMKMNIQLETIEVGFRDFWEKIGAEGDIEGAIKEFSIRHNASKEPNPKKPSLLGKILSKK